MLRCAVCEKTFADQPHLSRHQRDQHRGCTFCPADGCVYNVPNSRRYQLTEHLQRKHHQDPKLAEYCQEVEMQRQKPTATISKPPSTTSTMQPTPHTSTPKTTVPAPAPRHESIGSPIQLDFSSSEPMQKPPPMDKTPPPPPTPQASESSRLFREVCRLPAASPVPTASTDKPSTQQDLLQIACQASGVMLQTPLAPTRQLPAPTLFSEMTKDNLIQPAPIPGVKEATVGTSHKDAATMWEPPSKSTLADTPSSPEGTEAATQTVPTFPPKPIELELNERYAEEAVDPRLLFRNAPSVFRRSYPSGPLRKLRGDLSSRKAHFIKVTSGFSAVIIDEKALLQSGDTYTRQISFLRDLDWKITSAKGTQYSPPKDKTTEATKQPSQDKDQKPPQKKNKKGPTKQPSQNKD